MSVPAAYIAVIMIWSTTPLAIKWSGEGVGFIFGASARMAIGALLCLLFLWLLRKPFPRHAMAWRAYVAAALPLYGTMISVYWSAQYIPSGLVSVLFGLTPIITSVLGALWLEDHTLTRLRLIGMVTGLAGLAWIFHSDIVVSGMAVWGVMAVTLAVIIQATSAVWLKQLTTDMPALSVTSGGLLLSLPLYGLTWWLGGQHWPQELPTRAGLAIAYLGIFGSFIGFLLYFYMIRRVAVSTIALVTLITPVIALLLGHYLNGEPLGVDLWIGTATISLGLVFYQWGDIAVRRLARRGTVTCRR